MPRYAKNMVLLVKIETTSGVDAAPAAATDGILIVDKVDISPLEIDYASRNMLLPYFGGSQDLIAKVNSKISFSCELSGSGTAGTSAPWGPLMQACATAQASLTAPVRIEHTPVSSLLKTATIYLYDDGVLHKITGAMGDVSLSIKVGEVPRLSFDFVGAYAAPTAVANVSPTLTAWKVPLVAVKSNVIDITLGCTYATGALTGGTVFGSSGLDLKFANQTTFFASLSREGADITDRKPTCSFELELTAAQEVQAVTDIFTNATTSLGFTLGSVAGNKHLIHLPAIARKSIKKSDKDGVRTLSFEANVLPVNGNDEIRIIQL